MAPRILIVDDSPQVHKLLGTVLGQKKYEISSITDPRLALNVLDSFKPNLIILDLMMPEMSGIELCRAIRSHPKGAGMVILMLSAKDSQNDRIESLQYGADDFVTKPFHVSTLVNKIDHMLKKFSHVKTQPSFPSL